MQISFIKTIGVVLPLVMLLLLSCNNSNSKLDALTNRVVLDTFYVDTLDNTLRDVVDYENGKISYIARYNKYIRSSGSGDSVFSFFPVRLLEGIECRNILLHGDSLFGFYQELDENPRVILRICSLNGQCSNDTFRLHENGFSEYNVVSNTTQSPLIFDSVIVHCTIDRLYDTEPDSIYQIFTYNLKSKSVHPLGIPTRIIRKDSVLSVNERLPYLARYNNRLFVSQPYSHYVESYLWQEGGFHFEGRFYLGSTRKDRLTFLEKGAYPFPSTFKHEYYSSLIVDDINNKLIRIARLRSEEKDAEEFEFIAIILDLKILKRKEVILTKGETLKSKIFYFKQGAFYMYNVDKSVEQPGMFIFTGYKY